MRDFSKQNHFTDPKAHTKTNNNNWNVDKSIHLKNNETECRDWKQKKMEKKYAQQAKKEQQSADWIKSRTYSRYGSVQVSCKFTFGRSGIQLAEIKQFSLISVRLQFNASDDGGMPLKPCFGNDCVSVKCESEFTNLGALHGFLLSWLVISTVTSLSWLLLSISSCGKHDVPLSLILSLKFCSVVHFNSECSEHCICLHW